MVFHLKTKIVLNKEFDIEAEHLQDAMDMVKEQLAAGAVDFNELEIGEIGFDMTDASIREYNRRWCEEKLKEYEDALQDHS